MIRIYPGLDEGREAIRRRGGLDTMALAPEALERNRQIFGEPLEADEAVARILADVREKGDAAVRDYCERIDGAVPDPWILGPESMAAAWERTPRSLQDALTLAADRVRSFHQRQVRQNWIDWREGGLGQMIRPLRRVACYAPGGTAAYPSTVLMSAIPARVAGVEQVLVATPAGRDGTVKDVLLAACHVAGVDQVLCIGGAQAIGALAYGTATIEPVDKIVGPGNLYVVLAKRRVFGTVGIDALPGPTETLLIADETANPVYCAADLLAQAEHDPQATSILLTTSPDLAHQVAGELDRQLARLERASIAGASIERNGAIVVVPDIQAAIDLANEYAPEHLCLLVADPFRWLPAIRNAGGVFLGEASFEVLGDYVAGPSHTMPTGGTARFASALNVDDFTKITSVVALDHPSMLQLGEAAALLARSEGLTAHAHAVEVRLADAKVAAARTRQAGDGG